MICMSILPPWLRSDAFNNDTDRRCWTTNLSLFFCRTICRCRNSAIRAIATFLIKCPLPCGFVRRRRHSSQTATHDVVCTSRFNKGLRSWNSKLRQLLSLCQILKMTCLPILIVLIMSSALVRRKWSEQRLYRGRVPKGLTKNTSNVLSQKFKSTLTLCVQHAEDASEARDFWCSAPVRVVRHPTPVAVMGKVCCGRKTAVFSSWRKRIGCICGATFRLTETVHQATHARRFAHRRDGCRVCLVAITGEIHQQSHASRALTASSAVSCTVSVPAEIFIFILLSLELALYTPK